MKNPFYVLQKNNLTVLKNVCENSPLGLLRCGVQTIPNTFAPYMFLNENTVVCNILVVLFKSATLIWPSSHQNDILGQNICTRDS